MKTYNNVRELCEGEDAHNFWRLGRSIYKYTDCGPWCRLILEDGNDIYYESEKANDEATLDRTDVIGMEIGSIVEGSDVEIDGVLPKFPFTSEDLWETVKNVNEEASFYWKRDNEDDYLIEAGGEEYHVTIGGSIDFPEGMPKDIQTFIVEYYDEMADMLDGEIWEESGYTITKIDKSDFIF